MRDDIGRQNHLIIVSYSFQEGFADGRELIDKYWTLQNWAEGCQNNGIEVTVIQRFHRDEHINLNGVKSIFVKDILPPMPRFYYCAWHFNHQINEYITGVLSHANDLSRRLLNRSHIFIQQQKRRKIFEEKWTI